MPKRIRNGIVFPQIQYRSLLTPQIKPSPSPRFVNLGLASQGGFLAAPCVQARDRVFVGAKVAEGVVSVHSSVSGFVSEISERWIRIESDEANTLDKNVQVRQSIPTIPEELEGIIYDAGIVSLGQSGIPVYLRLSAARAKPIETLIMNGCQREPFLTANYLLMLNHPVEVLKGVELLRIASGAERAVVAVDEGQLEALEVLNSKIYQLKMGTIQTMRLPAFYPQGEERTLVSAVLGRSLDRKETPLSAGFLVEDAATAFAVYEAVFLGKPLYQRLISVEGACITEPKVFWVPIGISVRDVLRACKGLLRDPGRLVLGGPMTGEAISGLDYPVAKTTEAILALPAEVTEKGVEEACVRCGLCVETCPESLIPEMIVRTVRKRIRSLAREFQIEACTECGCCAYVCPSKIPLVEVIREGKKIFWTSKQKTTSSTSDHVFSLDLKS